MGVPFEQLKESPLESQKTLEDGSQESKKRLDQNIGLLRSFIYIPTRGCNRCFQGRFHFKNIQNSKWIQKFSRNSMSTASFRLPNSVGIFQVEQLFGIQNANIYPNNIYPRSHYWPCYPR